MSNDQHTRRSFLGTTAALGSASALGAEKPQQVTTAEPRPQGPGPHADSSSISYPRIFQDRGLKMIAFPLGGVGAGSVSLGGRGQLRDWEIFNRPDKGHHLPYAFPSIWVKRAGAEPVARVLEARYQPPYEGANGLGSDNAPGLPRLAKATFTGEFPLAHVEFEDPEFPVSVRLDAFSPFIPHEAEDSGLPVTVLRYTVHNPAAQTATVSVAWSIDNPVKGSDADAKTRSNDFQQTGDLSAIVMTNPGLPPIDVMNGSFVLATIGSGKLTRVKGWPQGRWWNSPLLFWDNFSAHGEPGPEPEHANTVGTVCVQQEIAPGSSAEYTFLLAWHFPNRTPARCGWQAPKGDEHTVIGNWYATRFQDALAVAAYTAQNLPRLEKDTHAFAEALRTSTVPAPVLDAASANLSTLVSTTCFRTADGEFHGFEGANDQQGCCFGNCTHVWNYETATAYLFPSLARSLRKAAFGFSMDDAGAMHFRQLLPDGKERSGFAAADGQMGQIVHAYLDWKLCGDREWLTHLWPRIRKAIAFAWVPGGWDANRDGVLEGVQHNTYDVEFYGPNPQCGIWYLAALRACEEMARAVGEPDFANECARLFKSGSQGIDAHLFNGNYYVQQVRPFAKNQIAPALRSNMGADDPEHPEYQIGQGCLVDQLVGQYLAQVCALGPLVAPSNIHKTLGSVYRFNYKRTLFTHENVQRTFALNDESALVICDYAGKPRPHIPFPYFAEVMTGFEYSTAAHMIYAGMENEGLECIASVRRRYDGERRNPWDEAECGHHYARAMAAWSGLLACSGFDYDAPRQHVAIKSHRPGFRCFWSSALGWGSFRQDAAGTHIRVLHGTLQIRTSVVGSRERTYNTPITLQAGEEQTL